MYNHRLYVFCREVDLPVMNNLAYGITEKTYELQSFSPIRGGIYGCNSAMNDDIKNILFSGIDAGYSLLQDTVYIARLTNGSNILETSYGVNASGYVDFMAESGHFISWDFAVNEVEQRYE